MPTVVIADDYAFSASGIGAAIGSMDGFEVVGVATNGIEAIALVKNHRPDCAILDLSMPGANGLEVFSEAKRWSPATRFAIITGNPSAAIFSQLVDAGVHGLFLKNSPPDSVCEGMRAIAGGARIIAPEVGRILRRADWTPRLTAREIEVLHGIARGYSNGKIASMLGISQKTIDSHRTTLMRKMGVHSTATLLVRAMREGLINVLETG